MGPKKLIGVARVNIQIEVVLDSVWPSHCTIGQLHKQAADEAIRDVSKLLVGTNVKIVSVPVVSGVITHKG